jgi:hypothetical protein
MHQQPLVYNRNVAALFPPRSCGEPGAAVAVDGLLMMGERMPEAC